MKLIIDLYYTNVCYFLSVSSQAVVGWIGKSEAYCQYLSLNSMDVKCFLHADKEIIKHRNEVDW